MIPGTIVSLVALEREHIETWRRWVNDPEIAAFVDRVLPVTEFEHERFFERYVQDNPSAVWFGIRSEKLGRYVGNVWLWNINPRHRNAELRILIGDREAWGSGAGTEAIKLLSVHAFAQMGLHKVYAYVMARNPRAKTAFEKAGYLQEAILREECFWDGTFSDVSRMSRFAAETPRLSG